MRQTKGVVKVCPCCGDTMNLVKVELAHHSSWWWACGTCGCTISYSSKEASELKEVEVD